VKTLVLNFIVIPAVAILIVLGMNLHPEIAIGILLIGVAPIMPLFPLFVSFARSGRPGTHAPILYASLLMVLSVPMTMFIARAIQLTAPGLEVNLVHVFIFLVGFQTVPVVIGYAIHERLTHRTALARKITTGCAVATLLIFIALSMAVSRQPLANLYGSDALVASILLVVVSLMLGWLVGGPDPKARKNLAMGTSLRNVGLSLLFAWVFFPDTLVADTVSVYAVFMLLFNILVASIWRWRANTLSTIPTIPTG
jgi:predicted Na+-dependent transporter